MGVPVRWFVLGLLALLSLVNYVIAQGECSGSSPCPDSNDCCSQFGYCGTTNAYCGDGCQNGPCEGQGGGGGGGLGSVVTSDMFAKLWPNRNQFYTYSAFITAAESFPKFGTTGSSAVQLREIAAYAAHVQQETAGLQYIREIDQSYDYCDTSYTQYPCNGNKFYGRGPLQLSWNYNYGVCDAALQLGILNTPDLVATNAVTSFKASLWFWNSGNSVIPSIHDVMVGNWQPSSADSAAGRLPGFGVTINIINGGIECGKNTDLAAARITYFKQFCTMLGASPGSNLECSSMKPWSAKLIAG